MANIGLLMLPVLFLLAIVVIAIIPVTVALIYRGSYNRHLNEQLSGDFPAKRWISPFALGLVIFLIEIVLMVGITVAGIVTFRANIGSGSNIVVDGNESNTYTSEDVPEEYALFDGYNMDGYEMTEINEGDFHYFCYKKAEAAEVDGPDYVLNIEYTGNSSYDQAFANMEFSDKFGSSSAGTVADASDHYYAVIDTGSMIYKSITYQDGVETSEEVPMKPEDIKVTYDLMLFNDITDDIEVSDIDSLTGDAIVGELKVDLNKIWG